MLTIAALLLITPATTLAQEGIWYIASDNSADKHPGVVYNAGTPATNYYIVPAANPQIGSAIDAYYSPNHNTQNGDPEKPFLSTLKTNRNFNSIWLIVASNEANYYYIIHAESGKYVIHEPPLPNDQSRRKAVHLQTIDNGDYNPATNSYFKFKFISNGSGYNIEPKNRTGYYLNPAGQNSENLYGTGSPLYHNGLVGLYNNASGNSIWHLEDASAAAELTPTIGDVQVASNTFTITSQAAAFSTFRYTTDGTTTPTATIGTANDGSAIPITGTWQVQAVGVFGSLVTPVAGPKTLSPASVAPTITNNFDGTINLSSPTPNAKIYYTTDGTTPSSSNGTLFVADFPLGDATVVMAITYLSDGTMPSAVTTYNVPHYTSPTIVFDNIASTATIVCPGATASHYTTDGTTPTTDDATYTAPIAIATPTTVRAIATSPGYQTSEPAALVIGQVSTPTIQNNGSNAVSITCPTEGVAIRYTLDGSTPTAASTLYTAPLREDVSSVAINAIALKEGMITSEVGHGTVVLQCDPPVITRNGFGFLISCPFPSSNVSIYYTDDGVSTPTTADALYSGRVDHTLPVTVKAIAVAPGYNNSEVTTLFLPLDLDGTGTEDNPYTIASQTDVNHFVSKANTAAGATAHYKVTATEPLDFSAAGAVALPFSGHFDGGLQPLVGLNHPLFDTIAGGKVSNVVLDNVNIGGTDVGAICAVARGAARIYNCGVLGGTIGGSGHVGGLVGLLDGDARVVFCYNYADITSGEYVGGLVGYNNVPTTSNNLKTMVFGCMFYGDITGGTSKAPIYNGEIIANAGTTGVGNYNYFRAEASYVQNLDIDVYNCALAAETRYLNRFEFFRHLLNSRRELAAWWVTGNVGDTALMAKWVLHPDSIVSGHPYPVLRKWGRYPSVVNIDTDHATTGVPANAGGKLGELTVKIRMGSGNALFTPHYPTDAEITMPRLTLTITDKDTARYNFNYYKVQLPYYNDVGTKNYNDYRVVTGWKIVEIFGGTSGSFTTGDDAPAYNFADRHCTDKDLYDTSGRVFNQGAYWDVPEGVDSITIEPYWALAAYFADSCRDVVYDVSMSTANSVAAVGGGKIFSNGDSIYIHGQRQKVYSTIANASDALGGSHSSHTVYDYAAVLVGNAHNIGLSSNVSDRPYSIMSVDLDNDHEPDYTYTLRFNGRSQCHPVRLDFVNIPGLGMAQKSTGGTGSYNLGICQPIGWFESTNTSIFHVTQFEYDRTNRGAAPYILQGGIFEQWVSGQNNDVKNLTTYFHLGGNVWFKEFHRGTHQDKQYISKHPPVSVTGGDYNAFYLTGLYRGDVDNYDDNAECYINGGRFGELAGAGQEGIGKTKGKGNITWIIENADIDEFYGGGINDAKPVTGNISTTIVGSRVGLFCGGPKFGDMTDSMTVVTTAAGCTFGTYFGAGYGGNSYSRRAPTNKSEVINIDWNTWVTAEYKRNYNATYGGVETQFEYQFLPMSNNTQNVARLFIEYVAFSLATTQDVTSTLTDCTVTGNFYGGGSLGKVDGNVTSTLDSCIVKGNVYGAGFSASLPRVGVMNLGGFTTEPEYDTNLGVYLQGVFPDTINYEWRHAETVNSTKTAINTTNHILYTTKDLTALGTVAGAVTLTISGNSEVGTLVDGNVKPGTGCVYGGGEESEVGVAGEPGSITVTLQGDTRVHGDVFGGGNRGKVTGNTRVMIQD